MVIGYLISGVVGGFVAVMGSLALGHPVVIALLAYSLSGMAGMIGFGLIARGGVRLF